MTKKGTRKKGRGKEQEEREGENATDQAPVVPSAESELFLLLDITAEPGEDGWQYCSLPVHTSLVSSLAERWPEAEKIYALSFHDAFRCLRLERDALCHYIFSKRYSMMCILIAYMYIDHSSDGSIISTAYLQQYSCNASNFYHNYKLYLFVAAFQILACYLVRERSYKEKTAVV